MNYKELFSKRIEELKDKKGLSWESLIYSAGLSKGVITDLKNAKVDPKLSTICKIAIALDMTPSELLNFDIDLSDLD